MQNSRFDGRTDSRKTGLHVVSDRDDRCQKRLEGFLFLLSECREENSEY